MSMNTTPEGQHLYFITLTVWHRKNKLQQAIVDEMREYNQIILHSSPDSLKDEVRSTVVRLNTIHTRCKPENVYGIADTDESIYITIGENVAQLKITPIMGEIAL